MDDVGLSALYAMKSGENSTVNIASMQFTQQHWDALYVKTSRWVPIIVE